MTNGKTPTLRHYSMQNLHWFDHLCDINLFDYSFEQNKNDIDRPTITTDGHPNVDRSYNWNLSIKTRQFVRYAGQSLYRNHL